MSSVSSVAAGRIPVDSSKEQAVDIWPKGTRLKLFGLTAACMLGVAVVFMGIVGFILALA